MAGRHYLPPDGLNHREVPLTRAAHPGRAAPMHDPRVVRRVPAPSHATSAALVEDLIASRHRDIQSLLIDNQRLAATHVALKQELAAVQQDLRHLSAAGVDVKAEKDAQVREVYERALKMEAEVRSIDALNADLAQVRADVQKLTASKQELEAKLKAVDGELVRARSELQQLQLPAVETEIETMRQHIQRGRAAIEYEKKVHASNLEQSQAMENNMISMAKEIEKLRAELANAEKRARAAAAAVTPNPEYAAGYASSGFVYSGNSYLDSYAMHQVQGTAADAGPQYGFVTSAPHGPYDTQQTHVQR